MPVTVLITRAEPAATQTAIGLERAGHKAFVLPLFEIVDLNNPIPQENYDAVIFTSKNAVDILKGRKDKFVSFNIPAFCVGEKTAKAAQEFGFTETHTAKGGGAALAELMVQMDLKGKSLFYPTTPDRSFDMKDALAPYDVAVTTIDIYQASFIPPDKETLTKAIKTVSNDYIFVYSSLSGEHLAANLEAHGLTNILKDCTLIGISNHAVKSLKHLQWKQILIADQPDEARMIALIK